MVTGMFTMDNISLPGGMMSMYANHLEYQVIGTDTWELTMDLNPHSQYPG